MADITTNTKVVQKDKIDDIFSFKNKEAFLLVTLILSIVSFVYSMSLSGTIATEEEKSYKTLFMINKLNPFYESAEEIKANQSQYEIDYLEADTLFLLLDEVQNYMKKIGIIKSMTISNIEMKQDDINFLRVGILGETNIDKYHKMLKDFSKYNILSKYSFNGSSLNGKYIIDLVIYYKGQLPADYKQKEINPEELKKEETKKDTELPAGNTTDTGTNTNGSNDTTTTPPVVEEKKSPFSNLKKPTQ